MVSNISRIMAKARYTSEPPVSTPTSLKLPDDLKMSHRTYGEVTFFAIASAVLSSARRMVCNDRICTCSARTSARSSRPAGTSSQHLMTTPYQSAFLKGTRLAGDTTPNGTFILRLIQKLSSPRPSRIFLR